ncbi:MAG: pyridoxamine 5'-phosphate oxidase [Anaerolineaceae bacterium]|nr:pyridoxamine 5'-phosphate oxidase [Anaerolineaceae bacterium]MCB9100979.1 pyridoxamine 5'-phosphate oxidase [Anaerolineales bacterium]
MSISENNLSVTDRRIEYESPALRRNTLKPNPLEQFKLWLDEAIAADIIEPQAMTLATATVDGVPSARTVLLRDYDERGFVFYTNYQSQKGRELAENPHAALTFYWAALHRQVRITGSVSRVSSEESDSYFKSRPEGSKIGAWASKQSQVLRSRAELEVEVKEFEAEFKGKEIPRPLYWGGYQLLPDMIEFWQGQPSRLHDRFRYVRQSDDSWVIQRLSP